MKQIEDKFAEIERRVRSLVFENKGLKGKIRDLEGDLAHARREALELQNFHGKRMHIREKVEKILNALEGVSSEEK